MFVLKPEHVARRTVQIMGKNRREVNLPFIMNIGTRIYQIMPEFIDFICKRSFFK